jgi:hypothetical protein
MWEAFGRRFRRNYFWIFLVLGAAWALKSFLHPFPATSWEEFISRSAMGAISGEAMLLAGLIYNGGLFIIGFGTAGLTQASGEVLPKFGEFPVLSQLWHAMEIPEVAASKSKQRTAMPSLRRRQQLLAMIISAKPQLIADRLLKEMRRGVTALHGEGMYTHQERKVLMIAVTVTELAQVKALVNSEDPNAFVIVTPASEILGRGFQPLNA